MIPACKGEVAIALLMPFSFPSSFQARWYSPDSLCVRGVTANGPWASSLCHSDQWISFWLSMSKTLQEKWRHSEASSQMAQWWSTYLPMQGTQAMQVQSPGWDDPLAKEMATQLVSLPEKSHGQKSLVGYSTWGHKELDTPGVTELKWSQERLGSPFGRRAKLLRNSGPRELLQWA